MAKISGNIKSSLKLLIQGGSATPAPPVGSALGQHGVNIMDFCKQFNAKTADRKGETVPVIITVFKDRTFSFVIKTALPTVIGKLEESRGVKSKLVNNLYIRV